MHAVTIVKFTLFVLCLRIHYVPLGQFPSICISIPPNDEGDCYRSKNCGCFARQLSKLFLTSVQCNGEVSLTFIGATNAYVSKVVFEIAIMIWISYLTGTIGELTRVEIHVRLLILFKRQHLSNRSRV